MELTLKKADKKTAELLHNILVACGKMMHDQLQLGHWYPFMDFDTFQDMMSNKMLYGVYQNNIPIATFNVSTEARHYYYPELWSTPNEKALYLGQLGITPRVHIKSKILFEKPLGHSVIELRNNFDDDKESLAEYQTRSWNEFLQLLERNVYYVYLQNTIIRPDATNPNRNFVAQPGHIAGFLTDANKHIIDASVMSLREQKGSGLIKGPDGKALILKGDVDGSPKDSLVYNIRFLTAEEELKKYFFSKVVGDLPSIRYLLSLPHLDPKGLKIKELLDSVRKTKDEYKTEYYILTDGTINEIRVKAKNCINGMYSGNNVKGKIINPHTQTGAWSLVRYFVGPEIRDIMLKGSNLYTDEKEGKKPLEDSLETVSLPTFRRFNGKKV